MERDLETGFLGIALCCMLVSGPRLCAAQMQSAAVTLSDAPATTPIRSSNSDICLLHQIQVFRWLRPREQVRLRGPASGS